MGERLEAFNTIVKDVKEQEKLIEDQIKSEVIYSHDDQMTMFKEGLKKEIDTYYEKELNELKNFSATEASQAKLKTKKELLMKRQDLVENVFAEAKKRIDTFVSSDEYEKYLYRKLSEIDAVKADSVFYVKKNDIDLMKKVLSLKNLNNTVNESIIMVGGFIMLNKADNIEYDYTFDTKIKEVKQWFQNNSGFTL